MCPTPLDPKDLPVAFIGTGVMGASMAGHLMRAGCRLRLYTRTRSRAQALLDQGALWADTPAEAAREAQVVFSIVGFPDDVEAVYLGTDGVLSAVQPGTVIADLTTSRPDLAQRIAEAALAQSCAALDAPVSGGDVGAREARLSIMVGGDSDAFEKVRPLFQAMGRNIVLQGPAGSGQYTKMVNQIVIASGMLGICESLTYAMASGLDPERVLTSISTGAAGSWSLDNLAPRILQGDYAPGFYVKHFLKDLTIALESASAMQLDLPGLTAARKLYAQLTEAGHGDDGTQALFRLYERQLDTNA